MRNMKHHGVQIRLADGSVVYSEGVGSVRFNPVVNGQEMPALEFTDVLYVLAIPICLHDCETNILYSGSGSSVVRAPGI